MTLDVPEATWLDERQQITFAELLASCGLAEAELRELVDYGALIPSGGAPGDWTFYASCVVTMRSACRLRDDLELDPPALALTLSLLERIHGLEAQLRELRAQLPQRAP